MHHCNSMQPFKCYMLTIRVQLVRVWCKSAVVLIIRYTIIIIIIVTCVPFAILVMVSLVGIGHVGTVVQVVLIAIFINVLVIITLISNQVIVYIGLMDRYRQVLKVLTHSILLYRNVIMHYGLIPGQDCVAMDSYHTGHQLHPCQCPSGQCCTHMGSCHSHSGFLREKLADENLRYKNNN